MTLAAERADLPAPGCSAIRRPARKKAWKTHACPPSEAFSNSRRDMPCPVPHASREKHHFRLGYEKARSLFEPESTLRADIDVDGSGDGPAREHVLALNDLSFFDTPLARVRFFRLENKAGMPELENLDPFMNSLMNYMPVSDVEMTAAGIINHDVDSDWNFSIALEELLDHWLENAEDDEYYHGVYYPPRRNTPLGAAYVSGKVSISLYTSRDGPPTDHYVFTHGMGHNFSLQHAPCGGTSDVDPKYPYSDARLGPRREWKFLEDRLIDSGEIYYDLMSFCDPTSVSDYNFGKAARYLEASARLVTQHLKVLTSNPAIRGIMFP